MSLTKNRTPTVESDATENTLVDNIAGQPDFIGLRTVIDSTSDAIFVKDLQGRYVLINSAGAEFIGKPATEILGKTDAELLPPPIARQNQENDLKILSTGETQTYEDTEEIGGDERTFHSTKSVYRDEQGKVLGVFGIARDITERKKARTERERLINELQEALAKVKVLEAILPICMHCKKVRDEQGAWVELDIYIVKHTNSDFSHGLCEECYKTKYPEIYAVKHPDESRE
jgi:PAS domain S-box-containing protein